MGSQHKYTIKMTHQNTRLDHPDLPAEETETSTEYRGLPSSKTPLFEANNAARYQRQTIVKQIQNQTRRSLICFVTGNRCVIDEEDTMPFVDLLHKLPKGGNVDMLLHTGGGSIDAAEKLMQILRNIIGESELRIIVPDFAKSAGTLMVLGADCVVMSDTSELGPIDPQMPFQDSTGQFRWQSVHNYIDAYDEYTKTLREQPDNIPARIMLGKLDPVTVKLCQSVENRARQSAENQLKGGMFRKGGNWTQTVSTLLNTHRWLSHSQMISWEDARYPEIGLVVEYLEPQSREWREYWRLYCLQRLAMEDNQKLFESEFVSLVIDGRTD